MIDAPGAAPPFRAVLKGGIPRSTPVRFLRISRVLGGVGTRTGVSALHDLGRGSLTASNYARWNPTHRKGRDEWGTRLLC
jgi:hypothetical protein